jgi:hypothetical protein
MHAGSESHRRFLLMSLGSTGASPWTAFGGPRDVGRAGNCQSPFGPSMAVRHTQIKFSFLTKP